MEEASDQEANSSGNEWHSGQDDDENDFEADDEGKEDVSGDESVVNGEPQSLVVQLRYGKHNAPGVPKVPVDEPPTAQDGHFTAVSEPRPPVAYSSTHLPPASLPSFGPSSALSNSSETPRQVPTMTAPLVPPVPAPEVVSQPAPAPSAPSMPFIPPPVTPSAEATKPAASIGPHGAQSTEAIAEAEPAFAQTQTQHFRGPNPAT